MHPANLTCRRSKIILSHKSNSLSNHPANERCFAFCEAAGTWRVQAQELRNGTRDGLPMLGQWGSQTCSRASDIVDYLGCALTVCRVFARALHNCRRVIKVSRLQVSDSSTSF